MFKIFHRHTLAFLLSIVVSFVSQAHTVSHVISAHSILLEHSTIGYDAGRSFSIDTNALRALLVAGGRISIAEFPGKASNETLILDLKPAFSSISVSTEIIIATVGGEYHLPAPDVAVFRGKVRGEPSSHVVIVRSDTKLFCSITREGGAVFDLAPKKNINGNDEYILIEENELLGSVRNSSDRTLSTSFTPFNCWNDGLVQPNELRPVDDLLQIARNRNSSLSQKMELLQKTGLLQTEVAVEADNYFFKAAGSNPSTVLSYIGAMFSMSSVLYEDEANITLHLSWVKIWATPDPYNAAGNAYALPDTVRKYWQAHYQNVPRDLAHVMTSIGYGGGGFGYFSLCDPAYSYSVSSPQTGHTYPTFAFTYDVYIISHEIGHNFGLPHSHNCYWNPPLDTCYTQDDPALHIADACQKLPITPRRSPGTIMSYCANANYTLSHNDFSQFKLDMTFSKKVDSVLRVNAESAVCIVPPTAKRLILLSPRGSERFTGDTTIDVQWTFANIDKVSLDYSTNGGIVWKQFAGPLSAAVGHTLWKIPNIQSDKMLVRVIEDAPQPIGDTSLLFLSVTRNANSVQKIFSDMQIFAAPNPAGDHILLTTANDVHITSYEILNELAMPISGFEKSQVRMEPLSIDLTRLPSGGYFIRVTGYSVGGAEFLRTLSFAHIR